MDPSSIRHLGEAHNLTTRCKLSRCMVHCNYTFHKRLSHTADSQNQRHRMTPASRPILHTHLTAEPDYVTPLLVLSDERCLGATARRCGRPGTGSPGCAPWAPGTSSRATCCRTPWRSASPSRRTCSTCITSTP